MMKKQIFFVITIALINLLSINIVHASTTNINIGCYDSATWLYGYSSTDGWTSVWEDAAFAAYGATIGTVDRLYEIDRNFMEFSLAPLEGYSSVESAILYIYIWDKWNEYDNNIIAFLKHAFNSSSATGDVKNDQIFGDQACLNCTIYNDVVLGSVGFDVTAFINKDLELGWHWASFTMIPYDHGWNAGSNGINFTGSNDPGNTYHVPYLSITYSSVPIPPSLILLGSGLIGIVGIRKKFKK